MPIRLAPALIAGCAAVMLVPSAGAILVLEGTWKEHKYGLALDLAAKPQFAAVIDIMPEADMRASGVWIGNDDEHGYVLTAAHNFCDDDVKKFGFLTTELNEHEPLSVTPHPAYICGSFDRMGFDFAIVTLKDKVDSAGEQPTLYDGGDEYGKTLTFLGYGRRGTGVQGSIEGADQVPAAAEAEIMMVATRPDEIPDDPTIEAGNYLVTFFAGEDGTRDPDSGETFNPVSSEAGALATGDSGGPAFIEIDGAWYIAGTNQSGTGEHYGDTSHFARVSGAKDWILEQFPGAKFGGAAE